MKDKTWVIVAILVVILPLPLVIISENIYSYTLLKLFGLSNIKDFYTIWLTFCGAIGIILNLYFNNKRLCYQSKQTEIQTSTNRHNNFTRSIELLGSDKYSVRLGAIYSLYYVAKEIKEYRSNVHDILNSHFKSIVKETEFTKIEIEGQLIIDLLCKKKNNDLIFSECNINFNNTNLKGFNFEEADLTGAFLFKADISGVYLHKANLTGALLASADLTESDLTDSHLEYTNLSGALLVRTNLYGVNLTNSLLQYTYLNGAILRNAIGLEETIGLENAIRIEEAIGIPEDILNKVRKQKGATAMT